MCAGTAERLSHRSPIVSIPYRLQVQVLETNHTSSSGTYQSDQLIGKMAPREDSDDSGRQESEKERTRPMSFLSVLESVATR